MIFLLTLRNLTTKDNSLIIEVRNREEQRLRNAINEDSEQAITDAKYGFISGALRETYVDNHEDTARTTRVIDSIVPQYRYQAMGQKHVPRH